MPSVPAPTPPAYPKQIIVLARGGRAGRTATELALEFEASEWTIRNWVLRTQADGGERWEALGLVRGQALMPGLARDPGGPAELDDQGDAPLDILNKLAPQIHRGLLLPRHGTLLEESQRWR